MGFGVSMLHVTNLIDVVLPQTYVLNGVSYTYVGFGRAEVEKYAFSPLFQLGLTFFPEARASLHVDAAYVGYADTFTYNGQLFVPFYLHKGWDSPLLGTTWVFRGLC